MPSTTETCIRDNQADIEIHNEQIAETFGELEELNVDGFPVQRNSVDTVSLLAPIGLCDEDMGQDCLDEPSSTKFEDLRHYVYLFLARWMFAFNISERAANAILKFFHLFLQVLLQQIGISTSIFTAISNLIPRSAFKLYNKLGIQKDSFQKYTACPSCNSIYDAETQDTSNGSQSWCTHVRYPNHPHSSKRKRCGEELGKVIRVNHNERKFLPKKMYCYNSIIQSLQTMFKRPLFYDKCQQWKDRQIVPGILRDIYDGRMWREFMDIDNTPFTKKPSNIGLMLNVDWFQPYANSPYSVGAIYASIMNLPRKLRFKMENIILIGMIPGPNEPDADGLVHYIRPLVDELIQLWTNGVTVMTNGSKVCIRVALMCIAADIPAARKLCGFLGHNAKMGCSRCTKEFKTGKLHICMYFLLYPYSPAHFDTIFHCLKKT
jgi:hypothetical protein